MERLNPISDNKEILDKEFPIKTILQLIAIAGLFGINLINILYFRQSTDNSVQELSETMKTPIPKSNYSGSAITNRTTEFHKTPGTSQPAPFSLAPIKLDEMTELWTITPTPLKHVE